MCLWYIAFTRADWRRVVVVEGTKYNTQIVTMAKEEAQAKRKEKKVKMS